MSVAERAAEHGVVEPGIEDFLRENERKELLRLSTAGSVDDGKSTLIGRLLYDSKGVYEDQIASIRKASVNQGAGALDFALLTDGLRAEREQGITIDVAYRYFSTPRRKFIIADTPGHEQYTRNMATGASTANLAIILIDARNGVLAQSRRHAFIATLLGIPHIVVAVNKMDLVDFSRDVFDRIREDFTRFAAPLSVPDLRFIPMSALAGDNVVTTSSRTPWYDGPSLLEHLETVPISTDRNLASFRFPVQYVIRPNLDFRGFAGQVASGLVRAGDTVMALPSGRTSRVASIVTYDGNLDQAFPPLSATICLEDEIDISRGDMLVHPGDAPHVARRLEAMVVWMHETPLEPGRPYLVKHTTQQTKGSVRAIRHKVDVNTLAEIPSATLQLNEIGLISIETVRPLFFDPYSTNRSTGAFILIDPVTNATVGAGMIRGLEAEESARRAARSEESFGAPPGEAARVTPAERWSRNGHRPATVFLKGALPLALALERQLFDRGCQVQVLPGEASAAMQAELSRVANEAGTIAISALASLEPAAVNRASEIIGSEYLIVVDAELLPAGTVEAALAICQMLIDRGIIAGQASSLMGGDGI